MALPPPSNPGQTVILALATSEAERQWLRRWNSGTSEQDFDRKKAQGRLEAIVLSV
jgi:hypothetical protein